MKFYVRQSLHLFVLIHFSIRLMTGPNLQSSVAFQSLKQVYCLHTPVVRVQSCTVFIIREVCTQFQEKYVQLPLGPEFDKIGRLILGIYTYKAWAKLL